LSEPGEAGPSGFLSEEWFADLAARLADRGPLEGDLDTGALRLGQVVTGVPGRGEVSWTLVLDAGRAVELVRDEGGPAEVTLVSGYEAARRLASGDATAAQLLEAGQIKIRGDARRLVAATKLLTELRGL
jgi:hypothetical protein